MAATLLLPSSYNVTPIAIKPQKLHQISGGSSLRSRAVHHHQRPDKLNSSQVVTSCSSYARNFFLFLTNILEQALLCPPPAELLVPHGVVRK